MADRLRRYLLGVGAMFGVFVLEQIALMPADLVGFIKHSTVFLQIALGIITTILAAFVAWLIIYLHRNGLKNREDPYFNERPSRKRQWLIAGIIFIGLIALLFAEGFVHQAPSENQEIIDKLAKRAPQLTAFTGILLAPALEELIFRGLFYDYFFMKLKKRWVLVVSVIVNGLLFALIHTSLLDPGAWIYFAMGCLFALMYLGTKDIRFNIGIHMLNNLIAFLPDLF